MNKVVAVLMVVLFFLISCSQPEAATLSAHTKSSNTQNTLATIADRVISVDAFKTHMAQSTDWFTYQFKQENNKNAFSNVNATDTQVNYLEKPLIRMYKI